MDIRDEIHDACVRLHIPLADFAQVPDSEARGLFQRFLHEFTGGVDAQWWWEHFTRPALSVSFSDGQAFTRIIRVVPNPDEHVWFVAEDAELPFYPVFDAAPRVIEQVIGECYGFEYYLISKDLSWLLCENHHDRLIAIGQLIQDRLRQLTT